MFLVRKETDGLNVYEEEEPARIAQFVSSGLKNVKEEIFKLGRFLGFAFPLTDLTPAERLVWDDNTPAPVKPPEGGRFPPAVRDRLGSEPVLLPSGRLAAGHDARLAARRRAGAPTPCGTSGPTRERPEFARAGPLPDFDPHGRQRLVREDREGARRRCSASSASRAACSRSRTSGSCASSSTRTAA